MLPQIKTILFACDLEGKTQSAMDMVMNLAITHQAKVFIMHAIEPLGAQTSNMITGYLSEQAVQAMREEGRKEIKERLDAEIKAFMDAHAEDMAGLQFPPEPLLVCGVPAEAIERTAEENGVDLIIMNSRTHSRLGQMIIGSTANKVIHHSHIPVLVVPIK